jgi:predicted DNA-binding protein
MAISTTVSLTLPPDGIQRLDNACAYLDMKKSALLRGMLESYLKEIELGMERDNWVAPKLQDKVIGVGVITPLPGK